MAKAGAMVVGSGNIGTDLLVKLARSEVLEPRWMVGIDPDSEGLRRAREMGVETAHEGVGPALGDGAVPDVLFEATSASVHARFAPLYEERGILAVDLTPAAVGPYVIPTVNLAEHLDRANVNLVTCGGQATIPVVAAVSRATQVDYAEIVATISSRSAGPGTRANIDEFTQTTARGIEVLGGATRGKAIIILNPAEPPILMRDTVYCSLPPDADQEAVRESIEAMAEDVRAYVPGYRLKAPPQFDEGRVAVFLEVEGAGDFLPAYAGNLDIMTAAAVKVGEEMILARKGAA